MNQDIPLTPEQCVFAAENHRLVSAFLQEYRLPEDEYYDVVVFGYLRAVRRYFSDARLWQYQFSTIAWRCMQAELRNDSRAKARIKRGPNYTSISISLLNDDSESVRKAQNHNDLMTQLETNLILHDLARLVSQRQMDAVRMRSDGYGIREIAHRQQATTKEVTALLDEAHRILRELCYA